ELEADLIDALDEPAPAREKTQRTAAVRPRRNIVWGGTIAVAAIAAAVVAAVLAMGWPKGPAGRVPAALAPGDVKSIAVLPLLNLSGDAAQEYVADGMTDELIGTLGTLGGVRVISRTSAMQFKGSK